MTTSGDTADRIERLADHLAGKGYLFNPRWRTALRAAQRHLFVPVRAWVSPDVPDAEPYGIDRDQDPDRWWDAAYAEAAILTQADDGKGDPTRNEGIWTSSLSAPGIVFAFLEQLDVRDHQRILEIGTGTGWTAALLAQRVGADNVTSIEIDPEMAERARANLAAAGVHPRLILGDGAAGHPGGAPYDRVHVTCGVTDIPAEWIAQVRPGAVIVLPWMPGFAGGYQARLIAAGDGTAVGRFTGSAGYMMLRSQRFPPIRCDEPDEATRTTTRLDPRTVARDSAGAALTIAAVLPDVIAASMLDVNGGFELRLGDRHGSSWATAAFVPGRAEFDVRQRGDRRLWDEVADAYLRWVRAGTPARERFGMTVTPDDQWLWLDDPAHRLTA
jgi:protein-L-isoaspartate(D-aspartate) O-methyltransferase